MFSAKSVIFLALVQYLCSAKELPAVFKTCKRDSADIANCVEEKANFVLPEILKGVSELDIPPLTNLKLPKIEAPPFLSYSFHFDGNVTDLDGISCTIAQFDMKNFVIRGILRLPKLKLKGKYKIQGFVGISITGEGLADVTLNDVSVYGGWTFSIRRQGGVDHFKPTTFTLTSYKVESISYHFDGLFDGDKDREKTANRFLNENWLVLAGNFLPRVPHFITEISYKVASRIGEKVSFDEMFPL